MWESWDWLRPGFRDLRARYQVSTVSFSCYGSSWEPLLLACSLGCFLSPTCISEFLVCLEEQISPTELSVIRLPWLHRFGLWAQLSRLAHITLGAVPPALETSRITVCERALPLFWGVKTIRRLYCPFPCWDLTHPVYWKEFTGDSWSPMDHDPVLNH